MSADRDRQRERLIKLIGETPRAVNTETAADFLLDNGVSVEVPEPVIAPGTTGKATVRDVPGVRLIRGPVKPDTGAWFSGMPVDGEHWHWDRHVTDFIPDPEPLTAEAVGRIAASVIDAMDRPDEVMSNLVRELLAPYVAKGGA